MEEVAKIAILDADTLEPLFINISPLKVSVSREKRATKFAVEDGTERSDHVVTELAEVVIDLISVEDIKNAYQALFTAWEKNTLVTFQSRVCSIEKMLIVAIPHDEDADRFNAFTGTIRLQEFLEVKPETGALPPRKVASKKQSSTSKRGQVRGQEAATPEAKVKSQGALREVVVASVDYFKKRGKPSAPN